MKLTFREKRAAPQKPGRSSFIRERGGALLLAIVIATILRWGTFEAFTIPTPSMEKSLLVGDFHFVSKLHYGPRTPATPLQVPLTHQTLWASSLPAYSDAIQLPSFRLPGFSSIRNGDVVVFNFPGEGQYPTDQRTNYIKRCVGIAGDSVLIRDRQVFVNGQALGRPEQFQYKYFLKARQPLDEAFFRGQGIRPQDIIRYDGGYLFDATPGQAARLQALAQVREVRLWEQEDSPGDLFPHAPGLYDWSTDNFGPVYIPKAGATVAITPSSLPFYEQVIREYERNPEVQVREGRLFIAGREVTRYTFKQNYYFMLGDNRHNSLDSRYWGFVPEDHIVGKAVLIWMSKGEAGGLLSSIRWGRVFSFIQ